MKTCPSVLRPALATLFLALMSPIASAQVITKDTKAIIAWVEKNVAAFDGAQGVSKALVVNGLGKKTYLMQNGRCSINIDTARKVVSVVNPYFPKDEEGLEGFDYGSGDTELKKTSASSHQIYWTVKDGYGDREATKCGFERQRTQIRYSLTVEPKRLIISEQYKCTLLRPSKNDGGLLWHYKHSFCEIK